MRSLVKSQPTSREPQKQSSGSYNAVHHDQIPMVFDSVSGHHEHRIKTGPEVNTIGARLLTLHRPFPLQASIPRLQRGDFDVSSLPSVLGLGARPPSSLLEGRPRLEKIEQNRQQLVDMLNNDVGQHATSPRLQSGGDALRGFNPLLKIGTSYAQE